MALLALDSDVHVIGVSSLAAGHLTLVPELVQALKEKGIGDTMLVVGGVIPPQDYQALYEAGVSMIFGPGTPIVTSANQMLDTLMSKI